ncbi:MAG: hypothetical protein ISS78_09000 [Phycisphaerae bacterium]|nr:hypothetical protein [Phycisphaerae bacterium]
MEGELLQAGIRAKLRTLRRLLRIRLVAEALAWLVVAVIALIFVTMGIDFLLRLPERPLRAGIMIVALTAVAWVAWRQLLWPLRVPMSDDDLALLVERHYAKLADRLISTVQFARWASEASLASRAMIARTAQEANQLAAAMNFSKTVERTNMWRLLGTAASAAAILAGFAVWQSDVMALWCRRNVLLADVDWPQNNYIEVQGRNFKVVRGDDLTVEILSDPAATPPPYVMLYARFPSVGGTEAKVDPYPADRNRFVKTFRSVTEQFTFYVVGGDDHRDKRKGHAVTVIDPPALRKVSFIVAYPPYMKQPPGHFDGAQAALPVPVASTVTVKAEVTKDLSSAKLILESADDKPAEQGEVKIENIAGRGGRPRPRGISGRFQVTRLNRGGARILRFVLIDTDGYTNRRGGTYVVQILADRAPSVDVKKSGVGPAVTPIAVIPLKISAKDDHGVTALRAGASVKSRKLEMKSDPVKFTSADPRRPIARHSLDLQGRKLRPGDVIGVTAEADDTLPKEMGGPNIGKSGALEFRIVKPEELMAELVRRQKALRLEFMEHIKLQDDARAKTLAAADAISADEVTPEARRWLGASAGVQSSVGAECARTAEMFAAILEEMENNRLGSARDHEQLRDGIVRPLKALGKPIRETTAALNEAAKIDSATTVKKKTLEIADLQEEIRKAMEAIRDRMEKLESRQELANQLEMIIKWSGELLKSIKEWSDTEVRGVLQPTTGPATGPGVEED